MKHRCVTLVRLYSKLSAYHKSKWRWLISGKRVYYKSLYRFNSYAFYISKGLYGRVDFYERSKHRSAYRRHNLEHICRINGRNIASISETNDHLIWISGSRSNITGGSSGLPIKIAVPRCSLLIWSAYMTTP